MMSSNTALVDYSSSSEEEQENINELYGSKIQVNSFTENKIQPVHLSKDIPPLPDDFLSLYLKKDLKEQRLNDTSIYQGRTRVTPHIEGNWATHIYIKGELSFYHLCSPKPFVEDIIKVTLQDFHFDWCKHIYESMAIHYSHVQSMLENAEEIDNHDARNEEEEIELHLSLSRPIYLKYFQIERFVTLLRNQLQHQTRLLYGFDSCSVFRNDTGTRWFLALDVCQRYEEELSRLTGKINGIAKTFHQPSFYENPRFHASFLWSNQSIDADSVITTNDKSQLHFLRNVQYEMSSILCKVGNRMYEVWKDE